MTMLISKIASMADACCPTSRMKKAMTGWASQSRPDMKFYKGELSLYRYREKGSGQPIVFAADPPVTIELYDELLDRYASNFRVFVVELPSMGFSVTKLGTGFSFSAINTAIIEFLENVVRSPSILAFSCVAGLGGVEIASRRPDLVSKVVLIQTPSWAQEVAWKKSRDPKRILAKPFIGQFAMHMLKKKRAPTWLDLAIGQRSHFKPFCETTLESLEHGAGWAFASAFQLYLTDEEPDLPKLSQPFLALWGMRDQTHLETDKNSSLTLGQNGHLISYEDLGHFPELEGVSQVYDDVFAFTR